MILNYVAIPDLLRCARTSHRMQEMVYDDTRWVQKLRAMGCWNETEARQRTAEAARQRRGDVPDGDAGHTRKKDSGGVLFDAVRDDTSRPQPAAHRKQKSEAEALANGFDAISLSSSKAAAGHARSASKSTQALHALDKVRSARGAARQEYGRIYGALAPFFFDLVNAPTHDQPRVFTVFKDPQQQAKMLAQLRLFARSDSSVGALQREESLMSMSSLFENAALREFEQGYAALDYDGSMKRYAHVLVELNGGNAAIDSYIHNHTLMRNKRALGDPLDCINHAFEGQVNLNPSRDFFEKLANALNADALVIHRVFPPTANVVQPFLDRIGDSIITDYVNPLFDEAHSGAIDMYLKLVTGVFEQSMQFVTALRNVSPKETELVREKAKEVVSSCFEPHVDLYLQEELEYFTSQATAEVERWDKQLSEQEQSAESFFMSNVQRQAVKRDFLTSFKKVLMMPINVLPSMTANSTATVTPATAAAVPPVVAEAPAPSLQPPPRVASPASAFIEGHGRSRSISPRPVEAPTNELAAKAAIMNSKLEGIASLFSIEVALTLVHAGRGSIGRAAPFVKLGGKYGGEAREQCETVFIRLLHVLGSKHVQPGFDKAVSHLSLYKAREATEHSQTGVQPLVTFLELVNVGDLIQQMVEVFFVQELVQPKLCDQDDFLNPAGKEKKKFEQMLDERVAAGLNKGIDALMDEVEYLCGSTQAATDFNPEATGDKSEPDTEVGATPTAKQVVQLVSSHTSMLVGSADKNLLDIFQQEVGLRLFGALCKHFKRQRISVVGAVRLISDVNAYFEYIQTLRNKDILRYFRALRELSQIFLVDGSRGKEIATIIADGDRYHGIFRAEEVYEFAERRADWYAIRAKVEKHMYGFGCLMM